MNPQAYQPNSLGHSIVALVFYLLMAVVILYSLVALYSLVRFGRNKILTIVIAIVYLIMIAGLYTAAVGNLNNLNF